NEDGCVAYVEQHFNSSDSASAGYSVVITGANASQTSKNWGRWYAQAVGREFGVKPGGSEGIKVGGYGGRGDENLRHTRMPAILLEPLFASNPQHAGWIRSEDGQQRLAMILCESIQRIVQGGGLIGFSVGHKYKPSKPNDRGADIFGGGTEADCAEAVLRRARVLLEQVGAVPEQRELRVLLGNEEIWKTGIDADADIRWDPVRGVLRIASESGNSITPADDEPATINQAEVAISKGLLTYDAEGMEGGRYHSRVLHVPSASSGLTIGRGYDMKEKTSAKIRTDLINAGVDKVSATQLSDAAGLKGDAAKQFIQDSGLSGFEISMPVQEKLFELIYDELEKDVIRICNKADCVKAYGSVAWQGLNPNIRDVVVDLRFRGDYHSRSRKFIQKHVAHNDLATFTEQMIERKNWVSVPEDRFNRRVAYLQA
ncbi:MAG: N-acetylmuramoyl-L-alanine amidase, partial [Mariprofundaceae bacterium]|nr:N-acetylmuramoyl-L-alanine amidase [Mariprofundaceae bacterium]